MRRILLPLVALVLAGLSTFAVRIWLEAQRQPAAVAAAKEPERRKAVLVAARELPVGAFIQPDSLRWQDWPDVATPDSYLVQGTADPADLTGAVVRRPGRRTATVERGTPAGRHHLSCRPPGYSRGVAGVRTGDSNEGSPQ